MDLVICMIINQILWSDGVCGVQWVQTDPIVTSSAASVIIMDIVCLCLYRDLILV